MAHLTLPADTTTASASRRRAATGRKVTAVLWILQVLMAGAFLMAAVTKFSSYPDVVETFDRIGLGDWFRYLIGALELAGAIGLLIPILSGPAALGLALLLIGATITQLSLFDPATAITPAAYLVPVIIIAWARRDRTARMLRLLHPRANTE